MPLRRLFLLVSIVPLAIGAFVARGDDSPANTAAGVTNSFSPPDRAWFAPGRFVYQRHCAPCHGLTGRGDGELVRGWAVRPRDFIRAEFKYRSTPHGTLPTNDDLERTIRHGVSGTAMPVFSQLTAREIRSVVEYIKFFSPAWLEANNHAPPVAPAPVPDWFGTRTGRARAALRGREIFQRACAACHGEKGDGRGPSADSLRDSQDRPVKPADLRGELRSGRSPEDTWRTIATGISGTPMAGFLDTLSAEEIWSLTVFIRSLKEE